MNGFCQMLFDTIVRVICLFYQNQLRLNSKQRHDMLYDVASIDLASGIKIESLDLRFSNHCNRVIT